jgi:hypothetical protein
MASENPDPKETKQLTTGDDSGKNLMEKVREGTSALKDRAIEEAKTYQDPQDTQVWKSIFRVSHDRSDPRNRSLAILSNVFLHLHPAKINRDAVRYPFTWGMGGITFYLFIVLTFTGVPSDVLLPPNEGGRVPRHSLSRARCSVRQVATEYASAGLPT